MVWVKEQKELSQSSFNVTSSVFLFLRELRNTLP